MKIRILLLSTVICFAITSKAITKPLQICFEKDMKNIIAFEKKCNSVPSNFEWSEVESNNFMFGYGNPMVFIRPKEGNIELTVEYFFQEDNSKLCSSIIFQWDNSVIWLPKIIEDTLDWAEEYKTVFMNLARNFKLDTNQFFFMKKYHNWDKDYFLKEYKEFEYENNKLSIELMYFFHTSQRRVRLYCDF